MKKHIFCFLFTLTTIAVSPFDVIANNETIESNVKQVLQIVDVNKADIETLSQLKGVGEKRAQAIIAYRELHGRFNSLEELLNVKGIGEQMLQLNKERIKL